jgi:nucleoside-diphosphate-sugar epimerase
MKKLVIGCGYLGTRVARLWQAQGDTVYVTTRSQERKSQFDGEGFQAVQLDVTRPETCSGLPAAETALIAVGFDRSAGLSLHQVYVDGLQNLLRALPTETKRIIYVSSTGVYGQTDDSWVDEQSDRRPTRLGGKACLAAEDLLGQHPLAARAIILRLAGIYGPNRIPRRDQIARGRPIPARPEGFLNLIHVDDAARVVLAAERHAVPPQVFTVSDGNPVRRKEFFGEVARRLGVDGPTFCDPEKAASHRRPSLGSKRVSNRKLLSGLGVSLAYSDYRVGLDAILGSG